MQTAKPMQFFYFANGKQHYVPHFFKKVLKFKVVYDILLSRFAGVAQLVAQLIRNELVAAKKSVGCTSDVEISIN